MFLKWVIVFYNFFKILFIINILLTVGFSKSIDYSNEIEILYDLNENFNIKNLSLEKFEKIDSPALGYINGAVWSKLEINSSENKTKIFVNPRMNINIIDVYIFKDKELIHSFNLGNSRGTSKNSIYSKFSNFTIEMKNNSNYTIISKLKSRSTINVNWIETDQPTFIKFIMFDMIYWGIFFGLVISLIIYNLSIFKSLKDYSFLIYCFHGFFALIFQFATNGIFYQFNLYDNLKIFNSISWISSQFSVISILLFAILFFNTKIKMPKIHKILLFFIFVSLSMIALFIYSFFNVEIINTFRSFTKILSFSILFFVVFVAIIAIKEKIPGAIYYFIGHGIFLFTIIYQQFDGILNNSNLISIYIVSIGLLFDIIFLSLASSSKISILKSEKEKIEKLLITQSNFSSIGKTIGNLSHQWKIPVVQLSTLIMQIEATLWKSNNESKKDISFIISKMKNILEFMNDTIKNFNNFYLNSSKELNFIPSDEIKIVLDLLSAKSLYVSCEIIQKLDNSITIFGNKNAFANSCLTLIDNSLDIIKEKNIIAPKIEIILEENEDYVFLYIKDNAGGILITPIENIFEIFVSKKENSSGMGLAICKMLIETKLNGQIKAYNIDSGACFEIIIPK